MAKLGKVFMHAWTRSPKLTCRRAGAALITLTFLFALQASRAFGQAPGDLKVERVVMLVRHGVRAPLPGEATETLARQAWPVWSTPGSFLTPHGREGMQLLGAYDRAMFQSEGLLPAQGCPAAGEIAIWTNAVERTISTGTALAEGLAPGCGVKVDHLPLGATDPLFIWPGPDIKGFDAAAAAKAINRETGGPSKIAAASGAAIHTLETILGCHGANVPQPCDIAATPAALTVSKDGKGLDLTGPIPITSGAAQVLMLEYEEGLPMSDVGWGRASLAQITEVSSLHGLLFDIYSRPPYIAPRVAGALARRLLAAIEGRGEDGRAAAPITLIVGHDDNIAAISALLGMNFQLPGYGYDDPPVGGALMFQVLRDPVTHERFVRILYQAQTPDQLRDLTPLDLEHPPTLEAMTPQCERAAHSLCRLNDFSALLERRLAP
jgi:4-phytase/acid phosphatase